MQAQHFSQHLLPLVCAHEGCLSLSQHVCRASQGRHATYPCRYMFLHKALVCAVQKKQSQVQHAKYAAVHESRTAEDRRTAAELSARLLKMRNEHKDIAAHVASELNQGPVSSGEQNSDGAAEQRAKQKEPWPVKVSCTACMHVTPELSRLHP